MAIFSENKHQPNTETQTQWHTSLKYKNYVLCVMKLLTVVYDSTFREAAAGEELRSAPSTDTCLQSGGIKVGIFN